MEIKGPGWWPRCEDYVYQHEVIDRVVLRDCHTVELVTAMSKKYCDGYHGRGRAHGRFMGGVFVETIIIMVGSHELPRKKGSWTFPWNCHGIKSMEVFIMDTSAVVGRK